MRFQTATAKATDAHRGVTHAVLGTPLTPPWPAGTESLVVGMGCFWGAERLFWQRKGVYTTRVGYAGGHSSDVSYRKVCSGTTGHAEVVEVIYDPEQVSFHDLMAVFWENHDPTQGNRQGNDRGSQYRSAIFTSSAEQAELAQASLEHYQQRLNQGNHGSITTEIAPLINFQVAEDYHQQYLFTNPGGYCNHGFCQARY